MRGLLAITGRAFGSRPRKAAFRGAWGDGWADAPPGGLDGSGPFDDDELTLLSSRLAHDGAAREEARRAAARACAEPAARWLARLRAEAAEMLAQPAPFVPRLAQATRFACATRVNAAYLWPALEPTHEALSAAAWLGWLACGRAALLPPALAGALPPLLAEPALAEGVAAGDGRARIVRPPRFGASPRGRFAAALRRVARPGSREGERPSWCGIGD